MFIQQVFFGCISGNGMFEALSFGIFSRATGHQENFPIVPFCNPFKLINCRLQGATIRGQPKLGSLLKTPRL